MIRFRGKKISRTAGNEERVMTADNDSIDGHRYSEGTRYQPHSRGFDNQRGFQVLTVSIDGQLVQFKA